MNVDPLDVNFTGNDFHLTLGSPVANAGLPGLVSGVTSMGAYQAP
jgi:hypothetical protein